jgi:hypothetical protein
MVLLNYLAIEQVIRTIVHHQCLCQLAPPHDSHPMLTMGFQRIEKLLEVMPQEIYE